ncbi:hypothetical protein NP233_g5705 [Leucocoprinus birnbaumii]|uniref:Uncharacterized protein n=1 Tax=Leucocoprinus birnbaumii TaxID=56174 RepID=A0AAD5VSC4_9AGAR|nr:hypothetical protein NP233_g5705 [Leucocoprinus birnbaumii]
MILPCQVLQIMVSQAILGLRVYNLAQRSESILYVGLFVYITTCSLQWVSTLVEREGADLWLTVSMEDSWSVVALIDSHFHNCRAFSEQPKHLGAWVFYTIAMVYDALMTLASGFYLLRYKLTSSSGSLMSKLINMMLSDGLGYLIALTATNAINVTLYKSSTDTQVGSRSSVYRVQHASRERRMESEDAVPAYSITSDILSPRELTELTQTQLTTNKPSRSNSATSRHRMRQHQPYDLEQGHNHMFLEERDIHVRAKQSSLSSC